VCVSVRCLCATDKPSRIPRCQFTIPLYLPRRTRFFLFCTQTIRYKEGNIISFFFVNICFLEYLLIGDDGKRSWFLRKSRQKGLTRIDVVTRLRSFVIVYPQSLTAVARKSPTDRCWGYSKPRDSSLYLRIMQIRFI